MHCVAHADGRETVYYQMDFKAAASEKPVTMLLPFPGEIENVFAAEKDHFTKLIAAFTIPSRGRVHLAVVAVGEYMTTIVPSVDQLDDLDPTVFGFDPKFIEVFKKQYPTGFSFVAFCFAPSAEVIKPGHPLGITFRSRLPVGCIFFPMLHIHDGHHVPETADYDHDLFMEWDGPDGVFNLNQPGWQRTPNELDYTVFRVRRCRMFRKGMSLKNQDLVVQLKA